MKNSNPDQTKGATRSAMSWGENKKKGETVGEKGTSV